jgi:DNA-binding XRE family transcriptional regulator
MRVIRRPALPLTSELPPLPTGARRRRPRDYAEWRALQSWDALPQWETSPGGYVLRRAREEAGLTQSELAERLGCTQQAIAQAERYESNPTLTFMRRWAEALGAELVVRVEPPAAWTRG